MSAITNLDDYVNLQTGGNNGNPSGFLWWKNGRIGGLNASTSGGQFLSLWRENGFPCAGAIPTTAAIPTNTTQGAFPVSAPGGSRQKWIVGAGVQSRRGGMVMIFDRLMHMGGLNTTSTLDQTVQGDPASVSITRNTGGIGNMIMWESYVVGGTGNVNITATYINENNVSKTTPSNPFLANAAGAAGFFSLADGDLGVKSVTSVKLLTSAGATAGDFGISIIRPVAYLAPPIQTSVFFRDHITGIPGMQELIGTECLFAVTMSASTGQRDIKGWFSTVEK